MRQGRRYNLRQQPKKVQRLRLEETTSKIYGTYQFNNYSEQPNVTLTDPETSEEATFQTPLPPSEIYDKHWTFPDPAVEAIEPLQLEMAEQDLDLEAYHTEFDFDDFLFGAPDVVGYSRSDFEVLADIASTAAEFLSFDL